MELPLKPEVEDYYIFCKTDDRVIVLRVGGAHNCDHYVWTTEKPWGDPWLASFDVCPSFSLWRREDAE